MIIFFFSFLCLFFPPPCFGFSFWCSSLVSLLFLSLCFTAERGASGQRMSNKDQLWSAFCFYECQWLRFDCCRDLGLLIGLLKLPGEGQIYYSSLVDLVDFDVESQLIGWKFVQNLICSKLRPQINLYGSSSDGLCEQRNLKAPVQN